MMVVESCQLNANLNAIIHYLNNISVMGESISITPELKRKANNFFVHDERLFHRTKCGIRFVPHIGMRESILKGLHDEVGHRDFNSTYEFVRDRFRWRNIRSEVANFERSCDACQKAKPANRKESLKKFRLVDYSTPVAWTLQGCYLVPVPEINT